MELPELLADAAAEIGDVSATETGLGTEWAVGGRVFCALETAGSTVHFRLDPVVAAAARNTPDAGASDRGDDWVRFSPPALDQFAGDRARAWFGSAYRWATSTHP